MQLDGILVGLGNPGEEYARTRHNYGFMLVDELLAQAATEPWAGLEKLSSSSRNFELWRTRFSPPPALPWLLIKPLTYMNLSGQAVVPAMSYFRVDNQNLVVVHDEMDLPLGHMRLKWGGGSAGHKGIISLEQSLGTNAFYRLRLGIGRPPANAAAGYVTSSFNPAELSIVKEVLAAACAAVRQFKKTGFDISRQTINSFRPTVVGPEQN
ncbi:MAG: aminoacyl-tRNA hydrolase [Desulfovibrionaceae bacterium]|nr:aminoacyl-tRNA hydrolase [Desulfovibrionaceae bacterium]